MLDRIDDIKKTYAGDDQVDLESASRNLYLELGPQLWPKFDTYAFEQKDPEFYPRPLHFFDDRETLWPLFLRSIEEKCKVYKGNVEEQRRRKMRDKESLALEGSDRQEQSSNQPLLGDDTIDYRTCSSTSPSPSTRDDGEHLRDSDTSYSDEDNKEEGDPAFRFPMPLSGPQLMVTPARSSGPTEVDVRKSSSRSRSLKWKRKRPVVKDADGDAGSKKRARCNSRENRSPTQAEHGQEEEDAIDHPVFDVDSTEDEASAHGRDSLIVRINVPQRTESRRQQSGLAADDPAMLLDLREYAEKALSTTHKEPRNSALDSTQSPGTISEREAHRGEGSDSNRLADSDIGRESSAELAPARDGDLSVDANSEHPGKEHSSQRQEVEHARRAAVYTTQQHLPDPANYSIHQYQDMSSRVLGGTPPVAIMSVDAPVASPVTANPAVPPASAALPKKAIIQKGSNRVEKGKDVRQEPELSLAKQMRADNNFRAETVQALRNDIMAFRRSERPADDISPLSSHANDPPLVERVDSLATAVGSKKLEQRPVAGPSKRRPSTPGDTNQDLCRETNQSALRTAAEFNDSTTASCDWFTSTQTHAESNMHTLDPELEVSIEGVTSQRLGSSNDVAVHTDTEPHVRPFVAVAETETVQSAASGGALPTSREAISPEAKPATQLLVSATVTSDVVLPALGHTALPAEGPSPRIPTHGAATVAEESSIPSQSLPAAQVPALPARTADTKPDAASSNTQARDENVRQRVVTESNKASPSQDAKAQSTATSSETGKIILIDWILKDDSSIIVSRLTHYTPKLWNALKEDMPDVFKAKKLVTLKPSKVIMSAFEVLERYSESIAANTLEECVQFLADEAYGDDAHVERTWQKATVVMRD